MMILKYIMETLKMEKKTAQGYVFGENRANLQGIDMMDSGQTTWCMGMVNIFMQMGINSLENFQITRKMVEESCTGESIASLRGIDTKANGKTTKWVERAYTTALMEVAMKDKWKMDLNMGLGLNAFLMEIDMKGSTKPVEGKETVFILGMMAAGMWGNGNKIKEMAMELNLGPMGASIQAHGKKTNKMVEEYLLTRTVM